MNILSPSGGAVPGAGSTAILKIARLCLAVPQDDIVAIEARAHVDMSQPSARSVGWITYARQRWPVYCLSDELALLFQIPAGRRNCVLLAQRTGYLGILCDQTSLAAEDLGRVHALPDAMRLPGTPIQGVMAMGDGTACASTARLLTAHVERMVARQ